MSKKILDFQIFCETFVDAASKTRLVKAAASFGLESFGYRVLAISIFFVFVFCFGYYLGIPRINKKLTNSTLTFHIRGCRFLKKLYKSLAQLF